MLGLVGSAAVVLIVIVMVILAMASAKPNLFQVERSIVIAEPPEKIVPLIADFHNWSLWSPWEHLDPAMRKTYSGAPAGNGAIFEWSGNSKAGQGRMEILSSTATATDVQLDFIKPFASHMQSHFTLAPETGGTHVTWSMSGPQTLIPSKVMSVFVSMDKMIGGDFDSGLSRLKSLAES